MPAPDPRQTLHDLIRRFGTALAEDPQRCKGMLRDLCGSSKREIAGLVAAIEEKIPIELMKPHPILVSLRANMIIRLENHRGLAHDVAVWTVDTWGLVLGTWTQADLDKFSPLPGSSAPPPRPTETVIDLSGVVVEPPKLDRTQDLALTATERQKGVKKTIVLDSGKSLEVTLPAGIKVGQQLRLQGEGSRDSATGIVGDLYLVVKERSESQVQIPRARTASQQAQATQLQWNINQVSLESEKGVDYQQLRDLLKAQNWKEADQETYRLMVMAARGNNEENYIRDEELRNFPCKDLKTIDRLWINASQGRYGFSIQKEIYLRCGAKLDGTYPGDEVWEKFGTEVGWRVNNQWLDYEKLTWNSIHVRGHLPGGRIRLDLVGVAG
jgi:GUN4-like/DnaJ C terminal domain